METNFCHFFITASYHENGAVYLNSMESLFLLPCHSCSMKVVFFEHRVFIWHLLSLNILVMEKCQMALGLFSWGNQSLVCCSMLSHNGSSKRSGMWGCALLFFSTLNGCLYSCASSCIQMSARIRWVSLHKWYVLHWAVEEADCKFTVLCHLVSMFGSCSALGWFTKFALPSAAKSFSMGFVTFLVSNDICTSSRYRKATRNIEKSRYRLTLVCHSWPALIPQAPAFNLALATAL